MRPNSPETSPESKPQTRKRPTITDVARAAGVSIAVVSYALNGRPGVSPATRDRVLRIADEYGWRPSAAARSLRTSERSIALALIHSESSTSRSGHFMDFLAGLQHTLEKHEHSLWLKVVADEEQAATMYHTGWLERRFDAVIVRDVIHDDPRLAVVSREHIPAVVVGHPQISSPHISVWVDEPHAIGQAVDLLCDLGHRTVGFLHSDPTRDTVSRTTQAARVSAARHGARLLTHVTRTPEDSAAAARALLTGTQRPTALVTDTDDTALITLDVARRLSLNVPWDLSLICLGSSAQATLATPSLTSIDIPFTALGEHVGHALMDLLSAGSSSNITVPLPPVSVRGTIAPPRNSDT